MEVNTIVSNDEEFIPSDDGTTNIANQSQPDIGVKMSSTQPELYMIITNISKRANVKSLVLSGLAFGCRGFLVVGQKNFNFSSAFGAGDTGKAILKLVHRLDSLEQCVQFVQHSLHAQICGIEIIDSALNVDTEPFTTSICIMVGNEGMGLSAKQMKHCDYFIKIPQYGGGTASLNVSVAASIVMQRFFQWRIRQCREDQNQNYSNND
jgi:tRNA G18 (ribose-2'-O)-methylase SpoU